MTPLLADITWAQLGEIAGALSLIGGFIVALIAMNRKTVTKIDQEPPPEFRKAAKRYNHDASEIRFSTIEKTAAAHEQKIIKIEDAFRVDLPAMERRLDDANEERVSEVHARVNDILGEVRELRGEMKGKL
jgi:hypothetical protein